MVDEDSLKARIFANVFVWCFLLYGLFFLAALNDYSMGWELSILSACEPFLLVRQTVLHVLADDPDLALAIHQLGIKVVGLQWIFSFVVMSLLITTSLGFTIPSFFGKELRFMGEVESVRRYRAEDDPERTSLLDDE